MTDKLKSFVSLQVKKEKEVNKTYAQNIANRLKI